MKRLVFCFDGTWNRLDAPCPTNVVVTAESVLPMAANGVAQLIYYDEGVGTTKFETLTGGLAGAGLTENLAQAYRFLIFNHTPGDEIYVFGFSRGAYTARSFVGLLYNCGILRRRDAGRAGEAIKFYQSRLPEDAADGPKARAFRAEFSPQVRVDDFEDDWRVANMPGYSAGMAPLLKVHYLGVWDTVGSLGIPKRYRVLQSADKYGYHYVQLNDFVTSARHALALDERRVDFGPSPWKGTATLNQARGFAPDAADAPYKERWFAGTHGSVGGGGDVRGLSDLALDWVLDGARMAGLELDSAEGSPIYGLCPDHMAPLDNVRTDRPKSMLSGLIGLLPTTDRDGPGNVYEVSVSARRRWVESKRGGTSYRPTSLTAVAAELDKLTATDVGLDAPTAQPGEFWLYRVRRGDMLGKLAKRFLGDAKRWPEIFEINRHKLSDPNRIYVGQELRIPGPPPSAAAG